MSAAGGVAMVLNQDSIASQVEQVVMTRGFADGIIGEMLWDVDFGSGTEYLRHKREASSEVDANLVRYLCIDALKKYVPDIVITNVIVSKSNESGGLALKIFIEWEFFKQKNSTTLNF
jgi:hypothetical protein